MIRVKMGGMSATFDPDTNGWTVDSNGKSDVSVAMFAGVLNRDSLKIGGQNRNEADILKVLRRSKNLVIESEHQECPAFAEMRRANEEKRLVDGIVRWAGC
jgi:actin-like ATPase involved in cell morphogenesis